MENRAEKQSSKSLINIAIISCVAQSKPFHP